MIISVRLKPYIQPFERSLAFAELEALTGQPPLPGPTDGEYMVSGPARLVAHLVEKLSFWQSVRNGTWQPTRQAITEATAAVIRNGISLNELQKLVPFGEDVALPQRRVLRYATHGIHEYRGKFFPQLVRSLMNISGLGASSVVADPMSGSGTTAVETILAGSKALATDMNPLSVFIGRTKCALLTAAPDIIASTYDRVRDALLNQTVCSGSWLATLCPDDQNYLRRWFEPAVLADLDRIVTVVRSVAKHEIVRDFMLVSLSNIVRSVSWQKNDDLRVRKEIRPDHEVDAVREFLDELGRSVRVVLSMLLQSGPLVKPAYSIEVGDARHAHRTWSRYRNRVDAVITSPPYATALPYIDTDRLSLCFLGLLPRGDHRKRDALMIGNREITDRQRRQTIQDFEARAHLLPEAVTALVRKVEALNSNSNVGFRRRNTSALLATYFFDMKAVFEATLAILKPHAAAYFVVGTNHTTAGGERVEIDTPTLLADVAASTGFQVERVLPMEMLPSRDIFRANSGTGESIITLRRV